MSISAHGAAGRASTPRDGGWEVVVACTAWADAVRRGLYMPADRLMAGLLSDPRAERVLVANPFRSAPVRAVRAFLGQAEPPLPEGPGVRVQLTPTRLRRQDPTSMPAIRQTYRSYGRHLQQAAGRLGMSSPAVVTGNPLVAAFSPLDWAGPVTFYAWDDWLSFPPHRAWWPAYRSAYERIREGGHRVVTVSQVLLDRIAPTGPCGVVPNGIAVEEWEHPSAPPSWFRALPSPRMLYVGTLDDRIDQEAVADVAARFPSGAIVVVGKEVDGQLCGLRKLANVHIHGPVGRAEVVALVHAADVCLMPHRRTPLTEAMSPLKLYEYLAGGRPVVATDLPPVRAVDPRIVLVPEGASFAEGVVEALDKGPLDEQDRLAFLAAHSWAECYERIVSVAVAGTGGHGP